MKKLMVSAAALALAASTATFAANAAEEKPAAAPPAPAAQGDSSVLKTDKEKVGYVIGLAIGTNLKRDEAGDSVDVDSIARGLRTGLAGDKPLLTDEQVQAVMQAFQEASMARRAARVKMIAEKNQKDGDAYLEANKKKEGVTTTASGLQYKVLKAGTGATPKPTDVVTVHYRGTLVDGKEFDSSYSRNEPATFPINGVIPGWQEALPLMKVGSKWQIALPAKLAYGDRGQGPDIGPNSVLCFDVELLSIQAPKPAAAGTTKPAVKPATKPAAKPAAAPKRAATTAKPKAKPAN